MPLRSPGIFIRRRLGDPASPGAVERGRWWGGPAPVAPEPPGPVISSFGTVLTPARFPILWSGAGAPSSPGTVIPDAGAASLTLTGSYSLEGTAGFAAAAIGSSRVGRGILLAPDAYLEAPSEALPSEFLLRVVTRRIATTANPRFLLNVPGSGNNTVIIFQNGATIQARVWNTNVDTPLSIDGSRFVTAGIEANDPLLIDVYSDGLERGIWVNGLSTIVTYADAFLGTPSSVPRYGRRSAGETWPAPVVGWGRADGAAAAWWSPAAHAEDLAALGAA